MPDAVDGGNANADRGSTAVLGGGMEGGDV